MNASSASAAEGSWRCAGAAAATASSGGDRDDVDGSGDGSLALRVDFFLLVRSAFVSDLDFFLSFFDFFASLAGGGVTSLSVSDDDGDETIHHASLVSQDFQHIDADTEYYFSLIHVFYVGVEIDKDMKRSR